MEDSTTKEFTDVILSLKKETLTMASQCLEIQRELSTILTAITFPKEIQKRYDILFSKYYKFDMK